MLHFYLAGINNQNFLMRDRETGTWWQQISGKAIFGKLKGQSLELAPFDELSFGLWKKESPGGQVLGAVARDQKKYESKWEDEVLKLPVPVSFSGHGAEVARRSGWAGSGRRCQGVSRRYDREAEPDSGSTGRQPNSGRSRAGWEVGTGIYQPG